MLSFLNKVDDCTGCSACASICPKHSITMQQDDEGFWYPCISDDCIHCRKCEKVCPSINRPIVASRIQQIAYAALSNDYKVWKRSSSGGAFSELCYVWSERSSNAVFCGAAWNGLSVEEHVVEGYDNIDHLCKSKYVASYTGDCFLRIKKAVQEGRRVVFCGTPCQIAGLRNYLGKDYDYLLLIDLICHGVGSPKVFQSCIEEIGKQFNDQVVAYEFRTKRKTFEIDYLSKVSFQSGKVYYLKNDQYMQLFLSLHALRPSCIQGCHYKNSARMGDVTIGDFKGLLEIFPDLLGEKKNYSTIVANTEKGKLVCEAIQDRMEMREVGVSDIIKYNPLFDHDTNLKNRRNLFFELFACDPHFAIQEFVHPAVISKRDIKRVLYDNFPAGFRKIVKKMRRR